MLKKLRLPGTDFTLAPEADHCYLDVEPKIGGKTSKMDGENNGKPYEQMDDLGGTIIFGNTHLLSTVRNFSAGSGSEDVFFRKGMSTDGCRMGSNHIKKRKDCQNQACFVRNKLVGKGWERHYQKDPARSRLFTDSDRSQTRKVLQNLSRNGVVFCGN